jgi:predicted nucleotidyltransferase component of viral defense system
VSLDLTELQSVAEQFGVSDEQVHRDHVVSHLLALISGELADAILFIGGTERSHTGVAQVLSWWHDYGRTAGAPPARKRSGAPR